MNILLKVQNLNYSVKNVEIFGRQENEKIILSDISFNLEHGKILGIAGESGSGKTTLAKILAGVIQKTSGELFFTFTNEWNKIKSSPVQILFQNTGEIINPFRTVNEIIEEAVFIRFRDKKLIKAEKENIFNSLNFSPSLWNRKGYELSGGEQQRAALARILAVKPELLILDEPFSAQDTESQLNFLKLFKTINEKFGITMITIAHNLKILRKLCDDIIIMYRGKIVEKGSTEDIFSSPNHPYTKYLLKAENYDLSYEDLKVDFN
jgi:peptide/nickel transport system ATP-binding protein